MLAVAGAGLLALTAVLVAEVIGEEEPCYEGSVGRRLWLPSGCADDLGPPTVGLVLLAALYALVVVPLGRRHARRRAAGRPVPPPAPATCVWCSKERRHDMCTGLALDHGEPHTGTVPCACAGRDHRR